MKQTRILYSDNGVLTDFSAELNKLRSGEKTIANWVAAEDALYVGNIAPFNHFLLKFGATKNTLASNMTVQYWGGRIWEDTVETIDGTEGFQQEGFISWVPDRNAAWNRSNTNSDGQNITGLTTVQIYDLYWIKITFSADLDPNIVLSYLGQQFSDDDDLAIEYPDLVRSDVLTQFESGKTNWQEQAIRAAGIIANELTNARIIWSKNQILERDVFRLASVSKVAELAYSAFGDDYLNDKQAARQEYQSRMKKSIYAVDLNEDGELSIGEQRIRSGYLSR